MKKIVVFFLVIFIFQPKTLFAKGDFNLWLKSFKESAVKKGISKQTVESVMSSARYLPKVIEYDRYQPEFYEDTKTYIKKRANKDKVKKGLDLYKNQKNIINKIENNFYIE